ncbi:YdgA family protein [Burkholderia perseverans]|uniref:YdgA family protein n=1 Tax=Burkholderia perseverans TaxID=2615214 RepID=UPI001FEF0FB8|nr:YdgA family protein [Burkholderia perseverans]
MRLHAAIIAGAFVLAPVLAMASDPVFVQVDGQPVAAHETSRIVQTAAGPAHVKTWSWQSPDGGASFVMQTSSSGGAAPAAPSMSPAMMRQMQARMQSQMRAQMAEMATLQARMQVQMQALQQAAFGGMPGFAGGPFDAMFVGPPVVVMQAPRPVLYLVPVAPPARAAAPARTPAPVPVAPATRNPGVEI